MASILPNPRREEPYGRVWQFGECEFDELRYELRVCDKVVDLEGKPLEVLHQLLLRAGDTVRKEELLESVWPGVLVVDASLATAVSKLRKVLGNEAIIKTVPKVGYRISVRVQRSISRERVAPKTNGNELPSDTAARQPEPVEIRATRHQTTLKWRLAAWTIAAVLLAAVAVGLTLRHGFKGVPIPGPVAILPFQNVGSNQSLDYLRSALPDEVANSLSAARSLIVRPLAASSKYSDPSLDLRTAARELNVNRIVTGHFVLAGDQLQLTMEAVDTDENRVLWHDTVNVPANNLLILQAQIAAMSRGKLAGALWRPATPPGRPRQLQPMRRLTSFTWKSLALDRDPAPRQARKSTCSDAPFLWIPRYAPAWGMLSLRHHRDSTFRGRLDPSMLRLFRCGRGTGKFALNPDSPEPVAESTLHRAEREKPVKAAPSKLFGNSVRRRPDNPNNHHAPSCMSFATAVRSTRRATNARWSALLAARIVWGSCSMTFMELGNQRAR